MLTSSVRGLLAMIACSTIWGLSPIYYKMLSDVPPASVLAHRTIWSLVFFGIILALRGRIGAMFALLRARRGLALVSLAAITISVNWFLFIMSVQTGRGLGASLGYYVFPLVAVMLGLLFFGEGLRKVQWLAVGLATGGVAVLGLGLGVMPWIPLALALSFGIYGAVKKTMAANPIVSVTAEVLLLSPLAVGWLAFGPEALAAPTPPGFDMGRMALLLLSGPITATPLILFAYASRRLRMATVGLLQYLNPTLQFLGATLIFAEPFGTVHAVAFALIWSALALYSADMLRAERASRKARMAASTVSATVI